MGVKLISTILASLCCPGTDDQESFFLVHNEDCKRLLLGETATCGDPAQSEFLWFIVWVWCFWGRIENCSRMWCVKPQWSLLQNSGDNTSVLTSSSHLSQSNLNKSSCSDCKNSGRPWCLVPAQSFSSCCHASGWNTFLYFSRSLQPSQNIQNTNAFKILQAHKYFNRLLGGTGLACYTVRMPKQTLRETFFF